GESEIRIGRRVWRAVLYARADLAARGDAQHRRSIAHRPCDIGWRFVSGEESLVGIYERVCYRRASARVLEQTTDVMKGSLAELVQAGCIIECVVVAAKQRLVRVHAAAALTEDRRGHERGDEAELLGHVFDDKPEGRDVVGGAQSIGVAKVDLVLAVRYLVMRGLD